MTVAARLLRSPPAPRPGRLLALAMLVWAAPSLLGVVLLALSLALGGTLGGAGLGLWAVGVALAFSPLLSWIGWAIALPVAWLLLRTQQFGWLSAALTGLGAGAIAAAILDSELATGYGLVSLLALRAILWPGQAPPPAA